MLEAQAQEMQKVHEAEIEAMRANMLKQVEAARDVVAPEPTPAPDYAEPTWTETVRGRQSALEAMPPPPPPITIEDVRAVVRQEIAQYSQPMPAPNPGDVYSTVPRNPVADRMRYTPGLRR